MHALMICNDGIPQDIDVAEMFSGVGHLVSAAKAAGMAALTYEILEDKIHQDICSPQGFLEALLMMMRLHLQGLVHWDTCCSNWIWMSRSGTGRNNANPMGAPSLSKVQIANLMVSRMCCLQLVAFAKYGIMILEQPGESGVQVGWLQNHYGCPRHGRPQRFSGVHNGVRRSGDWVVSELEAIACTQRLAAGELRQRLLRHRGRLLG